MNTQGNFWQGLTDHSRGKQDDFAANYDWDADDSSQSDYYTKFNKAGQDARNNYWSEATNAAQKSTWDSGSDWDLSSFNADGVDPDEFRNSVSHKGQGLYNVGDNYWFDRDSDAKFDSDKTFSNEGDAWAWMTTQGDDLTKGKFANFQAPWAQAQQQTWNSSPQWGNPWQQAWNPWTPPWANGWGNPWMNLPQPNFQTPQQTTTTTTADEAADLNAAKAKEEFRLSGEEAARYYNELTGSGHTHDDALSAAQEWYPDIDFSNWTYDSHTGATPPAELTRRERPPVVEETTPEAPIVEQAPKLPPKPVDPTPRATSSPTNSDGTESQGAEWWSDGSGGVTPDASQLLYDVLFEVPQDDGTMGLAKINEKVSLTDDNGAPSGTVWRDADHSIWYHPEGGQPMRIDKFSTSLATAETETLHEQLRDSKTEKDQVDTAADQGTLAVDSAISEAAQAKIDASDRLTDAEKSYADLYESDILDRLRGAKLRGQRATEFGTVGSTNRLLLQAEAAAAKDAARLRSGSDVAAAKRELGFTEAKAEAQLKNAAAGEMQKLESAKKMAAVYGSTPEETYGMITLAENMVEQASLEGEIDESNEQAIYDAIVQAANLFAKNPSIYELYSNMASKDMDLADLWKNMEDTLAQSRIANIAAIPGMAQAAIDYDPWMQLQNSYYGPAMAQWPYMGAFGFGNTSTIPTTAYGSNLYPALPNLGYQGAIEAGQTGQENIDDMWKDFLNTNVDGYFNP